MRASHERRVPAAAAGPARRRHCFCLSADRPSRRGARAGTGGEPHGTAAARPARDPAHAAAAESVTTHSIEIGGQKLAFTARAGAIRLLDANSGAAQADIAYVAFERTDAGDATTRPITFALNGGPGAASGFLDIGAMGPWRLPMLGAALAPSAPPITQTNAETWLPFTDLVFIDPPGTGFTRVLTESDDVRRHFYSVSGRYRPPGGHDPQVA